MSWLHAFRRYVRLPRRDDGLIERDVDDELRFHLDMRAEELRARGLSHERANSEALRRFGDVDDARRYCRHQDQVGEKARQWTTLLEEASQDAALAMRQLRRRPLFAAAALLTLSLGIGANTAIYSLVNAYLVRPFPFPEDHRIAAVIAGPSREPFPNAPRLNTVDWRTVDPLFDATVAWDLDGFTVVGSGQPEYEDGAWVSPRYFDVLGIRTAIGRTFTADDYQPDRRVALVSHALWTRRFGRDPNIVGTTVRMYSTDRPNEAELVTIVGVLGEGAWHLNQFTDVLRPLTTPRMPSLVRLLHGMQLAEAERRLTATVRAQLPSADPGVADVARVGTRRARAPGATDAAHPRRGGRFPFTPDLRERRGAPRCTRCGAATRDERACRVRCGTRTAGAAAPGRGGCAHRCRWRGRRRRCPARHQRNRRYGAAAPRSHRPRWRRHAPR